MNIPQRSATAMFPDKEKTNKIEHAGFQKIQCALVLSFCFFLAPELFAQDFISEWTFDEPATQITFSAQTDGQVNYTWSTSPSGNSGSGSFTRTLPTEVTLSDLEIETDDVVTIAMEPQNLERFFMGYGEDSDHLTDVVQWGAVEWTSMHNTFSGCENLIISANDNPNLANVTDMTSMFSGATIFNEDISDWDVSNVTMLYYLFYNAVQFNQDLNSWDVSSVTLMNSTFFNAAAFNGDITGWDVSNVNDMSNMFRGAESFNRDIGGWTLSDDVVLSSMFAGAVTFNQDISGWNFSNVIYMGGMFHGAESFNQDIGNWDVSGITVMKRVFSEAVSFNQDIGNWDVSSVEDMTDMFNDADSFNQDIGGWDVSNVLDMEGMFGNNDAFNQDIGDWDVSNVLFMRDMFGNATVFNADIGGWDVSAVVNMNDMFAEAESFNQDIGDWDVSGVEEMEKMFYEALAFNQDIGGWDVSNVEEMRDMFSEAEAFNQNLGNWILHPDVELNRSLEHSGMDCDNYSATLIGWRANNPGVTGKTLGAEDLEYGTNAAAARDSLITEQGWNIEFDTPSGEVCDGVTSVYALNAYNNERIDIYPNPTMDKVIISGTITDLEQITLLNLQGQDITDKSRITTNSSTQKEIDLSRLGAGLYVVRTATALKMVVKQ